MTRALIIYKMLSKQGQPLHITVRLDGKWVGNIADAPGGGYRYITKGGYTGETFQTVNAVKRSIEGASK